MSLKASIESGNLQSYDKQKYSCDSIPEYCNLFSGVELSIRLFRFILFVETEGSVTQEWRRGLLISKHFLGLLQVVRFYSLLGGLKQHFLYQINW